MAIKVTKKKKKENAFSTWMTYFSLKGNLVLISKSLKISLTAIKKKKKNRSLKYLSRILIKQFKKTYLSLNAYINKLEKKAKSIVLINPYLEF